MVYSIFKTKFGWCGIVGEKGRLLEIIPFLSTEKEVYSYLVSKYTYITDDAGCFKRVREAVKRYLEGEKVDLRFSFDLSRYTNFQRRVWEIAKSIPRGDVRTYGWVGTTLGNPVSARAVGRALAANPLPIVIPCHRVVKGNGELGGYSAAGGIDMKAKLLKMEGHKFDYKGRVLD